MAVVFNTYKVVCQDTYGGMTRHTIEAMDSESAQCFFEDCNQVVITVEEVLSESVPS